MLDFVTAGGSLWHHLSFCMYKEFSTDSYPAEIKQISAWEAKLRGKCAGLLQEATGFDFVFVK